MELLSWLDETAAPSPYPSIGRAPLLHVGPSGWTLALCALSVVGLVAVVVGLWRLSRNR